MKNDLQEKEEKGEDRVSFLPPNELHGESDRGGLTSCCLSHCRIHVH